MRHLIWADELKIFYNSSSKEAKPVLKTINWYNHTRLKHFEEFDWVRKVKKLFPSFLTSRITVKDRPNGDVLMSKIIKVLDLKTVSVKTISKSFVYLFNFALWMIFGHFVIGHFGWAFGLVLCDANFASPVDAVRTLNHSCNNRNWIVVIVAKEKKTLWLKKDCLHSDLILIKNCMHIKLWYFKADCLFINTQGKTNF